MRLVTYHASDGELHVGIVHEKEIIDLTVWLPLQEPLFLANFDMARLIAAPAQVWEQVTAAVAANGTARKGSASNVAFEAHRLYAPIPRPPANVLCLGRNYIEHAIESTRTWNDKLQVDKPEFPLIFTKAPTSITGPYDDIPYDLSVTTQLDWEGELAVIIGRMGKNISRDDAMQYVFGYTVLDDVTARDIQQRHGGQFFKGKSLDGSCPTGPWIVTADEIPDPHNLEITVRVNGVVKQHDNTGSMLFTIPEIIEHLSLGMTLEPGDIIATGTPSGVGFARTPPEFLKPGDVVEVEIEKIGTIRNAIRETRT